MSDSPSNPHRPESDDELESLLKKLEPAALDTDLVARLEREREMAVLSRAHDPTRVQWRRVIPLTLACCAVMIAYAIFQYGPAFRTEAASNKVASNDSTPNQATPVPVSSLDRFEPVSAQGYLINASSGGVVETEEGPREKMNLEYQDAYHWRDPETGTNIRYFHPRQEELIVPLHTD